MLCRKFSQLGREYEEGGEGEGRKKPNGRLNLRLLYFGKKESTRGIGGEHSGKGSRGSLMEKEAKRTERKRLQPVD